MRKIVVVLFVPLALVVSACGAEAPNVRVDRTTTGEPPAASDPRQLYEANATVLEDRTHAPMLCLGGILTSLPPQCGDVPLANWDWNAVTGEETAAGTTWGMYHVVGTYDGETFAVSEVGLVEKEPPAAQADRGSASPCAEPAGGWAGLDHTQDDASAANAYASAQTDYVTSWVTHLDPAEFEFSPVIFNAVFTGDGDRHRAEIMKVWGGPLCVVIRDVLTARELAAIRKEAEASLDELGLQMLWSHGPGVEPVIEIGVVVDVDAKGQATFDERYGRGVVRVVSALRAIS